MNPFKQNLSLTLLICTATYLLTDCSSSPKIESPPLQKQGEYALTRVDVDDPFWSPRLNLWRTVTVNDVFDKFEGKYTPEGAYLEKDFKVMGGTRNAFLNFDLVAEGKRGIGKHHGPPWYDGLIYESIRGAADLLAQHRDSLLESRIDGYIDRIGAAQNSEKDGYINTYTQLMEPGHRWGFNGGFLRWQHEVYNAGMLVEAGIHYYRATGKTKLLTIATRFANLMYNEMGPAPKKNVVPAHSGPEESLIKLYQLYRDNPALKEKVGISVNEKNYFDLAIFWIEDRGHHAGFPHWKQWGDEKSEKWIRDAKYTAAEFGNHSRPTWGDYAQDSVPVFQQKTIEGHAVRATLLATGIATAALENNDQRYVGVVNDLWDNMVGKRMFITGGVGAIARDEKFGADYFLPSDAYLETCAAVGSGFFSQRMNQLMGHGKYMDEFERSLYNNVLTGISLEGKDYTYQNPLAASSHHRWGWHDCPCCPPMFLKMVSSVPGFIYSTDSAGIAVNLFISGKAEIAGSNDNTIGIVQRTRYPWEGTTVIEVSPKREERFIIKVRIPGWAIGEENPFGLYKSSMTASVKLSVNDTEVPVAPVNGYAVIDRAWKSGDRIQLTLPMEPRIVHADGKVADLMSTAAISSGPLVYCLEKNLNKELDVMKLEGGMPMKVAFDGNLLGGINVVTGSASLNNGSYVDFKAIPYFAAGNLKKGDGYKVWVREAK